MELSDKHRRATNLLNIGILDIYGYTMTEST